MTDHPADETDLITLALVAFNQERYIEEATKSALEQTYSPLQVILSDDCSTDRTFKIMREVASAYRGPHEVLLHRNDGNLGLIAHLNQVAGQACGKIIVVAAGDDISRPVRVERIAAEFARGHNTRAVLSSYSEISASGETVRDVLLPPGFEPFTELTTLLRLGGYVGMGATFAYHADCFSTPRPIPNDVLCEDGLLPFRAALLGTIRYVREPLVLYRVHESSSTADARYMTESYQLVGQRVFVEELNWAFRTGLIDEKTYSTARRAVAGWPRVFARSQQLASSPVLARAYYGWRMKDIILRRALGRLQRRRAGGSLRPD